MKVKGVSPDGTAQLEFESPSIDTAFIEGLRNIDLSDESIRKTIDKLSVSADVKSLLHALSTASITIGRQLVRIGGIIIDFVFKMLSQFPKLAFFALLGAVAGFLVASIPLLGLVLGPIVTPIAIAVGAAFGALQDLKDQAVERKIAEFHAKFSPLRQANERQ